MTRARLMADSQAAVKVWRRLAESIGAIIMMLMMTVSPAVSASVSDAWWAAG